MFHLYVDRPKVYAITAVEAKGTMRGFNAGVSGIKRLIVQICSNPGAARSRLKGFTGLLRARCMGKRIRRDSNYRASRDNQLCDKTSIPLLH